MKTKIFILSILSILTLVSFTSAGEILLEPSNGKYSPGCMIGIDIVIDPEGEAISATDIVIESSMEFIKFENTQLFPYFFPPKTIDNIVHIVGFTTGPSQRVKEKGVVGKVFFKPRNTSDRDGNVKFYIKKKGDTTDTNLSIGGGVDVLEDTRNGFYTFDGDKCDYPEEEIIENTQRNTNNVEKEIKKIETQITKDHRSDTLRESREKNNGYVVGLFIFIIILVISFKVLRGRSKKN